MHENISEAPREKTQDTRLSIVIRRILKIITGKRQTQEAEAQTQTNLHEVALRKVADHRAQTQQMIDEAKEKRHREIAARVPDTAAISAALTENEDIVAELFIRDIEDFELKVTPRPDGFLGYFQTAQSTGPNWNGEMVSVVDIAGNEYDCEEFIESVALGIYPPLIRRESNRALLDDVAQSLGIREVRAVTWPRDATFYKAEKITNGINSMLEMITSKSGMILAIALTEEDINGTNVVYTEPMITKTTKVYNFTTNTFSQHTITTTPVTFGYKTDTQEKMISDLPKDTVLAAIRDARARISCGRY